MNWEIIPYNRHDEPIVTFGMRYRTFFFASRRVNKENKLLEKVPSELRFIKAYLLRPIKKYYF